MGAALAPQERDQAIDILRGLALITITINHITGFVFRTELTGMPFPTLSHWGFSSAAEVFFMVSGYLVGAVYFRVDKDSSVILFARRVWGRAGKLYLYNLALFFVLLPLCMVSPELARLGFFQYFIRGGLPAIGEFVILYVQPYCLEILVTYAALMIAAPVFAGLLKLQAIVAILLSLGLYWLGYEYTWTRIPGGTPTGDWRWNFNPASWQLLFFGTMAAGRYRLLDGLRRATGRHYAWLAIVVLIFAGLTILFMAQQWYGFTVWGQSKMRVGPVRLAHALVVCWLVLSLFWTWPRLQKLIISRLIAIVGSNSLQVFVASVIISYVAGYIWLEHARDYWSYIFLCIGGTLALVIYALGYHAWKRRPAGTWFRTPDLAFIRQV